MFDQSSLVARYSALTVTAEPLIGNLSILRISIVAELVKVADLHAISAGHLSAVDTARAQKARDLQPARSFLVASSPPL